MSLTTLPKPVAVTAEMMSRISEPGDFSGPESQKPSATAPPAIQAFCRRMNCKYGANCIILTVYIVFYYLLIYNQEEQRTMIPKKQAAAKWGFLAGITLAGFFADWLSKSFVENTLQPGQSINIIGHYLQIVLVYNKGMLFGFDPRTIYPGFPLHLFFFVFSTIAIIVLIVYYHNIRHDDFIMRLGVALILPGAVGNLWDRVIHPEKGVVDFIKMGVSETIYWPIYNFADIYVTIGVGIILFCFIRDEWKNRNASSQTSAHPPDALVQ
ncbi:MAG: signal peptidase II [Chitinivibrionales bacterium]|nr:signal peptidase II [Chitinivibrionales bacterium]